MKINAKSVIACAASIMFVMPMCASAADDAAAAAARARQAQINQQNAAAATAMKTRQLQINQQNAAAARARSTQTSSTGTASGYYTSTGTAMGYNTSRGNHTEMGPGPSGGATPDSRRAMEQIQADAKRLREKSQKPK